MNNKGMLSQNQTKVSTPVFFSRVNFIYWLQGFFEISEAPNVSKKQLQIITNHLSLIPVHEQDDFIGFLKGLIHKRDQLNIDLTTDLRNALEQQFVKITSIHQLGDLNNPLSPMFPKLSTTLIC